jgi:alginate O-acetyltransferase complex protein AlgJ
VVLAPDKSRIEAAELCGVDRPAAIGSRLADFTAQLRLAGIASVDVLAAMAASNGER